MEGRGWERGAGPGWQVKERGREVERGGAGRRGAEPEKGEGESRSKVYREKWFVETLRKMRLSGVLPHAHH